MENPFAEMLKNSKIPDYGRLSFDEQCAYYVALLPYKVSTSNEYVRFPPSVVASAAGVSQSTISLLSDAGKVRGGQLRYPKVAAEYAKLGHDAFVHKYLTPIIRERLAVALEAWKRRKRNPDLNDKGFNPRANRYVGRHDRLETSIDLPAHFYITEPIPDRGGYFWRNLKPRHDLPEIPVSQAPLEGDPARNGQGFATSQDAFRAALARLDPKL
jgi:hypothetical protein